MEFGKEKKVQIGEIGLLQAWFRFILGILLIKIALSPINTRRTENILLTEKKVLHDGF